MSDGQASLIAEPAVSEPVVFQAIKTFLESGAAGAFAEPIDMSTPLLGSGLELALDPAAHDLSRRAPACRDRGGGFRRRELRHGRHAGDLRRCQTQRALMSNPVLLHDLLQGREQLGGRDAIVHGRALAHLWRLSACGRDTRRSAGGIRGRARRSGGNPSPEVVRGMCRDLRDQSRQRGVRSRQRRAEAGTGPAYRCRLWSTRARQLDGNAGQARGKPRRSRRPPGVAVRRRWLRHSRRSAAGDGHCRGPCGNPLHLGLHRPAEGRDAEPPQSAGRHADRAHLSGIIGPDERILSILPFSFDYGLNQLLTAVEQRASRCCSRSRSATRSCARYSRASHNWACRRADDLGDPDAGARPLRASHVAAPALHHQFRRRRADRDGQAAAASCCRAHASS